MFKFEAFDILLKSLFKKRLLLWQSTILLGCLPVVSVQEILYPRCILGHKIGGFRASEGLPNKHGEPLS